MGSFIASLSGKISKESKILTKNDPGFAAALQRWSDIDRKEPAVIVQPASEHDVAVLVS